MGLGLGLGIPYGSCVHIGLCSIQGLFKSIEKLFRRFTSQLQLSGQIWPTKDVDTSERGKKKIDGEKKIDKRTTSRCIIFVDCLFDSLTLREMATLGPRV